MIPFFKKFVQAFLFDDLAFIRWARGAMLGFAAGGIAFGDQLAGIIGAPGAVKAIKITAVCCGFVAGAITAGQKNPKEVTDGSTPPA